MRERLASRRAEIAPERTDVQSFFDLQDLDDELSFGLTDLRRHPPRSPFDLSVGGLACLARMIDKFRAAHCNCLGDYWCGEDSGFDRAVLDFPRRRPRSLRRGNCGQRDRRGDSSVAGRAASQQKRGRQGRV